MFLFVRGKWPIEIILNPQILMKKSKDMVLICLENSKVENFIQNLRDLEMV